MDGSERNPTGRFSDRVENYIKYRPSYPPEVLATLQKHCGLKDSSVVADVGSGTGILTRLLLEKGNRVFAIEPNREMREAAERLLGGHEDFTSLPGSAEETGLPADSVDLIVAGQAFHWFDRGRAKAEFIRILRPGGWVALIWNERETTSSPFLREYEALLKKHATDYHWVNHMNIDQEILREFFAPENFQRADARNSQWFDYDGLEGRCLSSSYAPNAGQPGHQQMLAELKELFNRHQADGRVVFDYQTSVYYGRLRDIQDAMEC
ncbi:MAG: class I SAM-dependent methyltransferase [Verrucomicrobiota bacterium]